MLYENKKTVVISNTKINVKRLIHFEKKIAHVNAPTCKIVLLSFVIHLTHAHIYSFCNGNIFRNTVDERIACMSSHAHSLPVSW